MLIDIITQELKKRKITQKQLCKDIGMLEATFTSWKKGTMPSFDAAMKVLKYLNLSADEMYGIKETEYTSEERELIEKFRKMDLKSQDMIKAAMDAAASKKFYISRKSDAG